MWRFSFDKPTGRLWGADVGQNAWEEINIIDKGKNYGWRIMEGNHCYNLSTNCNTENLTIPIWEYGHNQNGGYSITGGFVYRGTNAQEIYGKYVYADFVSGNIWSLTYDGSTIINSLISGTSYQISTFGVDQNNELYFASYGNGRLYKLKGSPSTKVGFNNIPNNFQLFQNYPNPFNPTTTIEFGIPKSGTYSIRLYNILGQKIKTLTEKEFSPGFHKVVFDANSFSSGVYFYQLIGNNVNIVKKMILMK